MGKTITIPNSYHAALEKIAKERGITMTEVLKQAIGMEKFYWEEREKGNKLLIEDPKSDRFREIVRT